MATKTQHAAVLAQLAAVPAEQLGKALQEYIAHVQSEGWEGYSTSAAVGARALMADLLVVVENI